MAVLIAYVRPDNMSTITCPSCNRVRQLSVKKYRKTSHSLTARCACKAKFTIHLDFRLYYRKKTELPGTWKLLNFPGEEWGNMKVRNISNTGIGFSVIGQHQLKENQRLQLEFRLDNRDNTRIIKEVRVCAINNSYVGCAFVDQAPHERELRSYLIP